MNTRILASALISLTLGGVLLYPTIKDVGAVTVPGPDPITVIPPGDVTANQTKYPS